MKKYFLVLASTLSLVTLSSQLFAGNKLTNDITSEIPEIFSNSAENHGFKKVPNVAQYKAADWNHAFGIARNVSVNEAYDIANEHPEISFFFYTKGYQMVLERTDGTYRVFHQGDAVFFTGEPWWGSAPGLADGYIKQ